MLKKYNELINKLSKLEYSISRFDDYSIVDEYFMVDKFSNKNISYISVFVTEDEQFNIVIEIKNKYDEFEITEEKKYKTVKGAYKKIVNILEGN